MIYKSASTINLPESSELKTTAPIFRVISGFKTGIVHYVNDKGIQINDTLIMPNMNIFSQPITPGQAIAPAAIQSQQIEKELRIAVKMKIDLDNQLLKIDKMKAKFGLENEERTMFNKRKLK